MDYQDPYLIELKNEYEAFDIRGHKEDPYFPGVYILHIQFQEDSVYGLCIYDSNNNEFIEEPGEYVDYEVTVEEVETKYNFKHQEHENNDNTIS